MNYELRKKEETSRARSSRPSRLCHNSSPKGFALLFTVMASSVLLAVAIAIFNLALREVILSSYGRESQIAFYAADTGAECAMYWDMKGFFATSTDTIVPSPHQLFCGGETIDTNIQSGEGKHNATTLFSMQSVCADVVVAKTDPNGTGVSATQIDSRGHNTCVLTDPTRVERGLRVNY